MPSRLIYRFDFGKIKIIVIKNYCLYTVWGFPSQFR